MNCYLEYGEQKLAFLIVKNIGPISKVQIEITDDITAIIGPNASGKTFLSLSYLSVLESISAPLTSEWKSDIDLTNYLKEKIKSDEFEIDSLHLKGIIEKSLQESFSKSLKNNFGVETDKLISTKKREALISYSLESFTIEFKITHKDITCNFDQLEAIKIPVSISRFVSPGGFGSAGIKDNKILITATDKITEDSIFNLLIGQCMAYILKQNVAWPFGIAFLPTERGIAMAVFNGLVSLYLLNMSVNVFQQPFASQLLQNSNVPRMDKPSVQKFLSDLFGSFNILKNKEITIPDLHLKYTVGSTPVIQVKVDDHSIPSSLLSSGYSQLIPIDILGRTHQLIIIEEPELNLHAGLQKSMAQYLFNLNKRLFLTTHSEILLVQLGILSKKLKKQLKVYLLNDGTTTELNVMNNGDIDNILTISNVLNEQARELTGD